MNLFAFYAQSAMTVIPVRKPDTMIVFVYRNLFSRPVSYDGYTRASMCTCRFVYRDHAGTMQSVSMYRDHVGTMQTVYVQRLCSYHAKCRYVNFPVVSGHHVCVYLSVCKETRHHAKCQYVKRPDIHSVST